MYYVAAAAAKIKLQSNVSKQKKIGREPTATVLRFFFLREPIIFGLYR